MEEQMRLSEAIRAGAKLRPMGYGTYFEDMGEGVSSCALGAAYEVVTGDTSLEGAFEEDIDSTLELLYPSLFKLGGWIEGLSLASVIAIMNDSGQFTREEIADWLESVGL